MNRFDLEQKIMPLHQITEDLQLIMNKEFDTKEGLTEDEKMNLLIGLIELHKIRFDAALDCMEILIKQGNLK
jgi:hypothetical protein